MARAPLHVRIVMLCLYEFSELSILAANNLLSYLFSLSKTESTQKFCNISGAEVSLVQWASHSALAHCSEAATAK